MKNYSKMRKIIVVFNQYGINLSGKRKFVNLYDDLKMDQIFVLGLIYELELVTKRCMKDEDAYKVKAPAQIIELLIN